MSEEVIENKKKQQKAEDFIGKTFNNGKLKVVSVYKRIRGTTYYKVTCIECAKDSELFPLGYFISTKGHLKSGKLPCGCSKATRWEPFQYLILARRAGDGRFIVHSFSEEFHGGDTRLLCECLIDHHKWESTPNNLINKNTGCLKCSGVYRQTEQEALEKCKTICDEMDYEFLGFLKEYKNKKSRFKYRCNLHGITEVSYDNFVNQNRRCKGCAKHGYSPNKQGTFYIVKWTNENDNFIKFGITNQKLLSRIKQQHRVSEYEYEILYHRTWEDGHVADNLEKLIKHSKLFEFYVVDPCKFNDGFTETIKTENLNILLDLVTDYVMKLEQ